MESNQETTKTSTMSTSDAGSKVDTVNSSLCDCFYPTVRTASALPDSKNVELSAEALDERNATRANGAAHEKDMLDNVFEPVEAAVCGHEPQDGGKPGAIMANNSLVDKDVDKDVDDDKEETETEAADESFESNNDKLRMITKRGNVVELDSSVQSTEMVDTDMTPQEKEQFQANQEAKRRRNIMLGLFVAMLLMFSIALAVIFGMRSRNSSGNRAEEAVVPKGISLQNQCEQGMLIPSSSPFAMIDSTTAETSLLLDGTSTVPLCGDVLENGFGKWFTLIGDNKIYTASTCRGDGEDLDTQISVFAGSCNALDCVVANDNAPSCGDQSKTSWFATQTVEYHIFVHGYRDARGTFSLTVEPTTTSHDECSGSVVLDQTSSTVFGSTFGVSEGDAQQQIGRSCDRGSPFTNERGMWYEWEGTGEPVTISTCSVRTDYDALISVFEGGDCPDLNCIQEQQRGACGCDGERGELVRFDSEQGQIYHILIHRVIADDVEGGDSSFVGTFQMTLQSRADWDDANTNARCSDSVELSPGDSTSGILTRFVGAQQGVTLDCGDNELRADLPQKWHRVLGTGQSMTASTCNDGTTFDTQLAVLSVDGNDPNNACDNLQCIVSNDNDPLCDGESSTATWISVKDRAYYIVVNAFGSRSGSFTLTVN